MNKLIAAKFAKIARLKRSQIFSDESLMPVTSIDDVLQAAPGWVGPAWANGTLLIGINPGGGGDAYRGNPTDDLLYSACRALGGAENSTEETDALSKLTEIWMRSQKSHNIWRIVLPILKATGEHEDAIAFMNIVPFRTRNDAMPRVTEIKKALDISALPAIAELKPKRIIALGAKAYKALIKQPSTKALQIIEFKRRIGDSSIHPEAALVLKSLAQ